MTKRQKMATQSVIDRLDRIADAFDDLETQTENVGNELFELSQADIDALAISDEKKVEILAFVKRAQSSLGKIHNHSYTAKELLNDIEEEEAA